MPPATITLLCQPEWSASITCLHPVVEQGAGGEAGIAAASALWPKSGQAGGGECNP